MTLIDNVKQRANAQIDSQKSRATDTLGVIANAVRGTTDQLRTEHHDVLAQYIEGAANQLDRVSATLRNKDVNALLGDARQLARRQPALFVGGSFALGLLAARFLKSSARTQRPSWSEPDSPGSAIYTRSGRSPSADEGLPARPVSATNAPSPSSPPPASYAGAPGTPSTTKTPRKR